MQKTTVYLPIHLHERLRSTAKREGRPQADLVREAIEERLDRSDQHAPSIVGMFDEPVDVTSHDVKDRIRREWARTPPAT
jgi:Ribbon-helix-helix protein, copG family